MSKKPENPSAFPVPEGDHFYAEQGMTLRDWFAGHALSNPAICNGDTSVDDMRAWFGDRLNIRKQEIVAAQASSYADALLSEREGK